MAAVLHIRNIWRAKKYPSAFFRINRLYSTGTSKPLRILFCGSDDFSVASLRALHEESEQYPDFIKSIDVFCRPPKKTGRGLKTVQQVPLYHAAKDLGLSITQRETFSGWNLPEPHGEPINLIIAVSFGLFIPARIIGQAEFGGLNVHPSILPNYRGSAPLQRMIMFGAQKTGISLQTLDTKKFDHGVVLAQTRFRIPNPSTITYQGLLDMVTPSAAELLLKGLREYLFVPPLIDVTKDSYENSLLPEQLKLAPKIEKEDRHINWFRSDAAVRIDRRHRALGPMWSMVHVQQDTVKRYVFHDFQIVRRPDAVTDMVFKWKTGHWFMDQSCQTNLIPDARKGGMSTARFKDNKHIPDVFEVLKTADDQTENEALSSWQTFSSNQRTLSTPSTPKQNVYHMIISNTSGQLVPVFYIEDGSAIIVAIKGAGLRIREITIEGSTRKSAALAMKHFRKKGMWNLQFRTNDEGGDVWSANFNPGYRDTWDRRKWIESLPPEKREIEEDRDLWFQIREQKREERKLLGPLELLEKAKKKEAKAMSESKVVVTTQMQKDLEQFKTHKRAQRAKAEKKAREEAILEDKMKRNDWSSMLLARQKEFFPEAYEELQENLSKDKNLSEKEVSEKKAATEESTF